MIMATNMDISYRQGIRSKGFAITAATGITQQTLSLSGLAKSFEGFLLSSAFTATPQTIIDQPAQLRITLTINNDTCIDDDLAVSYALTSTGGFTGGFPFFIPIPRRLTGQDTIQLRITNSAASQNVECTSLVPQRAVIITECRNLEGPTSLVGPFC
jgi:hypothetical protein